jgi:hypothetical protein
LQLNKKPLPAKDADRGESWFLKKSIFGDRQSCEQFDIDSHRDCHGNVVFIVGIFHDRHNA